eukprot:scaffold85028_cov65-Attheya_sp.AAC.1
MINVVLDRHDEVVGPRSPYATPVLRNQYWLRKASRVPNVPDMTADEQIIELKIALLHIHSQVLRFTVALDRLADTIGIDAAPVAATATAETGHTTHAENSTNFQQNVLIYAQRRAARRTLTAAVHAGALIPRDALGFVVEQPESGDEQIDILHLRPLPPVDYSDDSEIETPVQEAGLPPGQSDDDSGRCAHCN